jgi:hypothetical protein
MGHVPCPACGGSMRFCECMDDPFAAVPRPLGPDGFTPLAPESVENARRAEQAERRAEDAEAAIEATRDLLDGWEHDGPDDYAVRLLIQRVRETLALGERFRADRGDER